LVSSLRAGQINPKSPVAGVRRVSRAAAGEELAAGGRAPLLVVRVLNDLLLLDAGIAGRAGKESHGPWRADVESHPSNEELRATCPKRANGAVASEQSCT
jgi:hypothetical protein